MAAAPSSFPDWLDDSSTVLVDEDGRPVRAIDVEMPAPGAANVIDASDFFARRAAALASRDPVSAPKSVWAAAREKYAGMVRRLLPSSPAAPAEPLPEKKSWFSRNLPTVAAAFSSRAQEAAGRPVPGIHPESGPYARTFGAGVTLRNVSRTVIVPDGRGRRFLKPFSFEVPSSFEQVRPGCALDRLAGLERKEGRGAQAADETLSVLRALQSADFFFDASCDDYSNDELEAVRRATAHEKSVTYDPQYSPHLALPEASRACKRVGMAASLPLQDRIARDGIGSFALLLELTTSFVKRSGKLGLPDRDVEQNANLTPDAWSRMSSRERLERYAKVTAALASLLS